MVKKKRRNPSASIPSKLLLQILVVVGLIGGIVGASFGLKKFFTVHTIECTLLSGGACPPELLQSLSVLQGQNMFFEDYTKKLLTSETLHQPVSVVSIKKYFPQTVIVILQQEPPAYVITHNGSPTVVSKSGRIFNHQMDSSGLIPVEIPDSVINTEGFIDSQIHQVILTLIDTSSQMHFPLTKIAWVDKSTIKLSMENSSEVFILDSEHPIEQLNKLSLVLKSGEYKDVKEPKVELDLRFTMPVLRIQE